MTASSPDGRDATASVASTAGHIGARHVRLALAGLVLANLCLACGPWLVRLADVGPLSSAFWRLAIAAPALLLVARAAGRPVSATPRALWPVLAVAGLAFAADLAAWHIGILHTRLANATLFANCASFFFPLYGFVAARAWPGRGQMVALALAALGVGLLVGRSFELSQQNVLGDLLRLAAGLFYTVYLVAMERARGRVAPLPALALFTIVALVPLLPFALALEPIFWPRDWTPLVLLALGSQVIGQGLVIYAIGHLSPLVVGLGLLSQPVLAAAIGWLAYGERLTAIDGIGAAAIAVALILVRRSPRATAA
ncbi:DMT family transporter [Sphingomonas solaris]|uniref:DMT family transporter n=1 Tax=Alterirhizorhabdus solaris TaxID=2529389 RepID=A0A558R8P1_9SPHN|nr:DMT family transporter [Sphingomonas solaris]TVV75652.1 DMT family transporter [Sphingomonas solaris]